MIAIDTNLLVYSHRADSAFHEAAVSVLDELAASGRVWGVVWQCVHEFLAIATHPKIYSPASSMDKAMEEVENWRMCPTFRLIAEGPAHWKSLAPILKSSRVVGPKVHDARIAAVCLQHGVSELWSVDRDFSRFAQLKVVNPLIKRRR